MHDYNAMTNQNRVHCMRTRALALDIVYWLDWRYEGLGWMTLFMRTLARHCTALYVYKAKAEAQDIEGAPHCTLKDISMQLAAVFYPGSLLQRIIDVAIKDALDKADTNDVSLSIDDIWDYRPTSERDQDEEYESLYLMNIEMIITDTRFNR